MNVPPGNSFGLDKILSSIEYLKSKKIALTANNDVDQTASVDVVS